MNFRIEHDLLTEIQFSTACANKDCDAESGPQKSQNEQIVWMTQHVKDTGHRHYKRTCVDHALLIPRAGTAGSAP